MIWFILAAVVVVVLWFVFFDPNTKRIRDIQRLLNIDRSVCDVINSLDDWEITPYNTIGLRIVIDPKVMPMYNMYITYKGENPSIEKIKELHFELTNENSIVTKAHKQGVPVETYMQNMARGNAVSKNAASKRQGANNTNISNAEIDKTKEFSFGDCIMIVLIVLFLICGGFAIANAIQ